MSEWIKVADADDLKPGEMKAVEVEDEEVVLARTESGDFLATSDVCSHEYVLMHDGFLEEHRIECPEHGSQFDMRTGEVMNLPATQPIPVYDVKVEDGAVYLKGPKEGLKS